MMDNPLSGRMIDDMKAYDDVLYFVKKHLGIGWLWPKQIEVLTEFYKPGIQNTVLICGMRSGKTTTASIITCYEAFKMISRGTPCKYYGLPAGTEIFIINVATSDRQAKDTVFAHVKARIANSPWFQEQKYIEHYNEYIFPTRDGKVILRSEHSNSASLAGKTIICVSFDELSRFKDTGGNSSAAMVYDTLSRSVKTFGKDGRKVIITSPMYVKDYAMELYNQFKGKPGWYCKRWPTWEMNPNITFEMLEDEFDKDPETAWRDWGAIPSAAIETFFKEGYKLDNCISRAKNPTYEGTDGRWRINPDWRGLPGVKYFAAGDPAVKNDSFGLAVGHLDPNKDIPIVDIIHEFKPFKNVDEIKEIDAKEVADFIFDLTTRCELDIFVTDIWNYPETLQSIREKGVEIIQNHVTVKEYTSFKESAYSGKLEFVNYEKLLEELKSVELIRGQKIDHPKTGSKDVADAVVNLVWHLKPENTLEGVREVPVYVTF
jgi:hypothetical protein